MKRVSLCIIASFALAGTAGAVVAADVTGIVQARQAHYREIGRAIRGIAEALNAPAPQVSAIQAYARQIDALAPQVPSWFPAGSGPASGARTGAKPDIWARPADFKAAAGAFAAEAGQFDRVAASGDLAAIRAEFPALGKTCKSCHENFLKKD